MQKRYFIGRILEKNVFDIKVIYGIPSKIEEKLTDKHPCIVCKKDLGADYETVFIIKANNKYDAEMALLDYITIPKHTIRWK